MSWEEFAEYYDWELELFCIKQKQDIKLWSYLAEKYGDPVLELACGSGRITLPLAERGYKITALDNSERMLRPLLKRSAAITNLSVLKADMVDFKIPERFKFCFIPYSSFQQLLNQEDQLKCLKNIYTHLEKDGILALDIGTHICEGEDQPEFQPHYTAEHPEDDSVISMYTSFRTDRDKSIRHWKDKYIKTDAKGKRTDFINHISLMDLPVSEMTELLHICNFELIDLFGSFERDPYSEDSDNTIFVAKKLAGDQ